MLTGVKQSQAAEGVPEERLKELLKYHYGLTLRKANPAARGWRLATNRGIYTLSRVEKMDEAYWNMIDELLSHLREQGAAQLPGLIRTKYGKLMFNGFRSRYLLWDNLQGMACDWTKPGTWTSVGKTLAHIHRASRDFPLEKEYARFTAAGNWRTLWERNLELLDTIRTACVLSAKPRPVDRLWMSVYTYTTTLIETALRYMEKTGGDAHVLAQMENGTVGQHQLNRDSWGVYPSGALSLLDWEHTVLDIRVRDLAQMIHLAYGDKKVFRERVRLLLSGYQSVHPLKKSEWPLLYARLLFPEQLVQTVRDVYEKHDLSPNDAPPVLERIIEDQRKREYHLRLIPRIFQETAQISVPEVEWLK